MDKLRPPQAAVGFIHVLGTDQSEFARPKPVEGLGDCREQRHQVYHPIGSGPDQHDPEGQLPDVLLMLEIPIHGQQGVETARNSSEQLAVRDAAPAFGSDRCRGAAGD